MRHGNKVNHLGRTHSHREAMLQNMASSLIMHKRIETTLAKAKELRKFVEPILTRAKEDNNQNRKVVFQSLANKETIIELFGAVADKIADRPGGYTRIIKLGNRAGDNAETCLIELVDFNETLLAAAAEKAAATTRTRRSRRGGGSRAATADADVAAPIAETTVAPVTDIADADVVVADVALVEIPVVEAAVVETPVGEVIVVDETPSVVAVVVETVTPEAVTPSTGGDDLTVVEGIGPKIAELLNAAGISTFAQLADANDATVQQVLTDAGSNYNPHDATTWNEQAALARDGRMDELKELQDRLKGGKEA